MDVVRVLKNEKMNKELAERVNIALSKIRPYLNADGGDVKLLDISDDNTVKVEFMGACRGCPYSYMTLKAGVEEAIRKDIPEIKDVIATEAE
jgi:Fe-S cluster biogenesis protein NfuA